jgi:glycosyltransferase involved in cell wall biosynthesis
MKIGIVSNLYPPAARGGAELVAQRIADELYIRGHEVFVLSSQPYDGVRTLFPSIRERTLASVYRFFPFNFYYLRHDHAVPFPIRALWHVVDLFNPFSRSAVKNVIHDENPDVILTHNLKGIGVSIGREIQKRGIPHIHTLHDVQLSVPSGLLIAGCENSWQNTSFLRRWYEKGVMSQIGTPDIVISPSKFLAQFHKERGMMTDSPIEIIPNPLPPGKINPRGERVPGPTRFLYIGQLEKHKGIMEMFDALEQLPDDVELHIAGEGTMTEYVVARAERDHRIKHHGFISLKHLVSLLRTSDAVVVPSTCYENSPTVIYESFLIGVPVIASKIGGIPELIEDRETGWLVEPGNVDQLAEGMLRCHEHLDLWWAMTKTIRSKVEKYSAKNYVDQLEALIQKVVK